MLNPSEVKWGSYNGYEGPLHWGTKKFSLPSNPSDNHRILAVITATEGGAFDGVNMYDKCIISVGLIQWCESAYFLTSNLLGYIADRDPGLMAPLKPSLDAASATFQRKGPGKWRFFMRGDEVDTATEQQKLFLGASNGHIGTWDGASKAQAKLWVASAVNTLSQEGALQAQTDFTAARVKTFATESAKAVLFDNLPSDGLVGATRAAYLSFAANNPSLASKALEASLKLTRAPKWSKDWCITVLKQLTFGPGITIYPHRYDKIRPVIEGLYGVDLPDFAPELKAFQEALQLLDTGAPTFMDPKEIQQLLIELGYDIGPSGADGKLGTKSKDALRTFQGLNKLETDANPGKMTRAKLVEAWHGLHG